MILHGNASEHWFLQQNNVIVTNYPDLMPRNFHLFPYVKDCMKDSAQVQAAS
jgi:hypothetical protein